MNVKHELPGVNGCTVLTQLNRPARWTSNRLNARHATPIGERKSAFHFKWYFEIYIKITRFRVSSSSLIHLSVRPSVRWFVLCNFFIVFDSSSPNILSFNLFLKSTYRKKSFAKQKKKWFYFIYRLWSSFDEINFRRKENIARFVLSSNTFNRLDGISAFFWFCQA